VSGIYEYLDVPSVTWIQLEATVYDGQNALAEKTSSIDLERFTLAASGTWAFDFGLTETTRIFVGTTMGDATKSDLMVSRPQSGSFTLVPPDSILFIDGEGQSDPFGGTIVPPHLEIEGRVFTRQ
jgi:hypothetical protein